MGRNQKGDCLPRHLPKNGCRPSSSAFTALDTAGPSDTPFQHKLATGIQLLAPRPHGALFSGVILYLV